MNQLSLLNGTNTAARSCENEPQKDGSLTCKCGMGTLDCSIHPNTPDKWIASMQASLARILALPANRQELAQKHGVASTAKSSASLGWFDPNTCSLKTSQQSLITDSEQSLQTLPRSGMTRNGFVYELPIVGRNTIGIDGGCLPTPTCNMVSGGANHNSPQVKSGNHGLNIAGFVQMFPTPAARDWKDNGKSPAELSRNSTTLATHAGGTLNPTWVEWLMGFPIEYSVLKDSEMPKSRSKQR